MNKKIISVVLTLFCLLVSGKSYAFSLFEDIGVDKGKWIVVKDELTEHRNIARAHLLPDGNVVIFGGCGIGFNEKTVDIFNPEQKRIIKVIPMHNETWATSRYNTVSFKNGDIYVNYIVIKDNRNVAKIFDCKTYTFKDIKPIKEDSLSQALFTLDDGNILLISKIPSGRPIYIYDRNKNDYFKPNGKVPKNESFYSTHSYSLKNGDIFLSFREKNYLFSKNKFEECYQHIPHGHITIPIDKEIFLTLEPKYDHTNGYIYNIKENKKIPVKNKINKTWPGNPLYPETILLDNKNVLILGIYADKQEVGANSKYSSYIYNFEKNKFFKIQNPPYIIGKHTGIVKLKNGDILFAGGQTAGEGKKIQIYSYKH